MDEPDTLDGTKLFKLTSQLFLGGVKADSANKQGLERIPLHNHVWYTEPVRRLVIGPSKYIAILQLSNNLAHLNLLRHWHLCLDPSLSGFLPLLPLPADTGTLSLSQMMYQIHPSDQCLSCFTSRSCCLPTRSILHHHAKSLEQCLTAETFHISWPSHMSGQLPLTAQ